MSKRGTELLGVYVATASFLGINGSSIHGVCDWTVFAYLTVLGVMQCIVSLFARTVVVCNDYTCKLL